MRRIPTGLCSVERRSRRHDVTGSAVYTWHCSYYRTESDEYEDDSETSSSNST